MKEDSLQKAHDLQKQLEQIKADLAEAKKEAKKDKRAARNHALIVAGSIVMQHIGEGDWRCFDPEKLDRFCEGHSEQLAKCEAKKLSLFDADARIRNWEDEQRKAKKKAAEAEAASKAEADSEVEIVTDDGGDSGYELAADGQPRPQQRYQQPYGGSC